MRGSQYGSWRDDAEGKSLAIINQGIMVKMYGYESIEEAEASL